MTAKQYRAAIKRLGLSQRAAAKFIGINERTSRRYAKSGAPKKIENLLAFALKAAKPTAVNE